MGDSIALWDPRRFGPEPADFAAACQMYVKLAEAPDEPNNTFAIFAQRIQSHVRIYLGKDEVLMHMFGHFLEVAQSCRRALFVIDMPANARSELLPLMATTASALGLVLFDEGSGLVLTPQGVLEAPWREGIKTDARKEESSDFPTKLADFKKKALLDLNAFFNKHGFLEGKILRYGEYQDVLQREVVGGVQQISFVIESKYGDFFTHIYVSVDSPAVASVWDAFGVRPQFRPVYFNVGSVFYGQELCIKSWADWDDVMHCFEQKLMPVLDRAVDIQGMDAVVNGDEFPDVRDRGAWLMKRQPNALIIARLAGNPCYADLISILRDSSIKHATGEYREKLLNEFERLVSHLESVSPLVASPSASA